MSNKKFNLGKNFGDNIQSHSFGHGSKFNREIQEINWQESLIGISSAVRNILTIPTFRVWVIIAVISIFFVVILGRLFYLQVVTGNSFLTKSFYNSIRLEVIHPQRGVIYDRNGVVLAKSKPFFRVAAEPDLLDSDSAQLNLISRILKLDSKVIASKLKGSQIPVTIANIDKDTALEIELEESRLPDISVEISPIRDYPLGEAFGILLGYTGEISPEEIVSSHQFYTFGDIKGKTGIEESLDSSLRGQAGRELVKVDSTGERRSFSNKIEALSGQDAVLSLDSRLQINLYNSLKAVVEKVRTPGASAVAIDPKNGQLLALVSYPSYNNNLFAKGISQIEYEKLLKDSSLPLLNRSISGEYPPASTFKLVTAAAALSERTITKEKVLKAPGSISVGGLTFRDWKDHGEADMVKALAESSDTYFYQIGGGYQNVTGVGPEKIADYANKFGLGKTSGINLSGESAGFMPTPEWKKRTRNEDWYTGNTYNISIGQGDILATPLQIAQFTTVLVSGGNLYKPTYIKDEKPQILSSQIISSEVSQTIREGMKAAVAPGGTAWPLRDFRIPTGAKTGTAESQSAPHAIMTAFAPYDNPEIVITVLVEHGGQGSDIAGPVIRSALEEYFRGR